MALKARYSASMPFRTITWDVHLAVFESTELSMEQNVLQEVRDHHKEFLQNR